MVNQTVSKTVVDFFAGKSEAEIENILRFANRRKHFKKTNNAAGYINPGRVIFTYLFLCGRIMIYAQWNLRIAYAEFC